MGSAGMPVVREVTLRLAQPDERLHWDALTDQKYPSGFKRFAGRRLRHVAEWKGRRLALLGWQSGVFQCLPREQWFGRNKAVQFQRLHLIPNTTRFASATLRPPPPPARGCPLPAFSAPQEDSILLGNPPKLMSPSIRLATMSPSTHLVSAVLRPEPRRPA